MAWDQLSLTRVVLLGMLAPLAAAADPKGSAAGLASEPIDKGTVYASNSTASPGQSPPVPGWWDSKLCAATFCVYANQRLASGRGLVAVTRADEFVKLERLEDHLDRAESRVLQDPAPFARTEILHKGPGLTATSPIRRGKPLLSAAPVLIVHRAFFDLVPKKKERTRLLDAALSYLPPETQALFNTQRAAPHLQSVEQVLLAHPVEVDLAYASHKQTAPTGPNGEKLDPDPHAHSRHFANYPEAAAFQHDCRPNVATHLDAAFALRATVARKVAEGEELSVSWVRDPFQERRERGEWVGSHRGMAGGEKKGCPCQACREKGGKEADERLKEIVRIRGELRNHESTKVDLAMVERFLELYLAERLHVKLAEAYELAATNFNYLGDDKRAKKYAELAVQAGIVEGGAESNDVAAMRVMAKDVKGHYSYRYKLKRVGL